MTQADFRKLYPQPSSCLSADYTATVARREKVLDCWGKPLPPIRDNPAAFLVTAARSWLPDWP